MAPPRIKAIRLPVRLRPTPRREKLRHANRQGLGAQKHANDGRLDELQDYLVEQDRAQSQTVRKAQNEAAQLRQYAEQAVGQEKAQLEEVRQRYEAALPELYNMLSQNDKFADIQSFDDVKRLASTDWARYIEYDAHVKELGIVQAQMLQAQQRQMQEYGHNWMRWSTQRIRNSPPRFPK